MSSVAWVVTRVGIMGADEDHHPRDRNFQERLGFVSNDVSPHKQYQIEEESVEVFVRAYERMIV